MSKHSQPISLLCIVPFALIFLLSSNSVSGITYLPAPALPVGHPFENVGMVGSTYWTNSEQKDHNEVVWIIKPNLGKVEEYLKIFGSFIWPVLDSK